MQLGISAFAWTRRFEPRHLALLPRVREYGFAALEIPMFDPGDLPLRELRRALDAEALACTVCAILPPGINPISPDAGTRAQAREHLARCVQAAAELGARLIGGPLCAPIGYLPGHRPTADEWSWAVEAFQSVGELLDQHAITLSIEPVNRSETHLLRTAADAGRLCEAVGHRRLGVTLDTFHANIEEKSLPAAIELLGSRLAHVHLSENDRGALGRGHVDFPTILQTLRAAGYTGYLMVEGFGYSADEPDAPGFLDADPSVSPEQLARSGYAFLSRLLA